MGTALNHPESGASKEQPDREGRSTNRNTEIALEEKLLIARLSDSRSHAQAFRELVKLYQEMLYWHVRKILPAHEDADDALQNTFIKAWKNIAGFRGESKLKTWLYRIATNEALTLLKKQKRVAFTDLGDLHDNIQHSQVNSNTVSGEEIQRKLQQAVASLPEKQRLVFNMKYYDELKYEEIADILGGTVGSLKASFHHAVKKIEKYLQTG